MAEDKKMMEEDREDNYITLQFEDGNDVECEILGVFEADGKEYIALAPDDGTADIYIYGYIEMEEEFELVDITDDEEFERASIVLNEIIGEEVIDQEAE